MSLPRVTQTCYNNVRILDHPCLPNARRLDEGCLPMIWQFHQHGIAIDKQHFSDLAVKLREKLAVLVDEMDLMLGRPGKLLNYNSGDQVAHLLFHELGLRPRTQDGTPKMTKGGAREKCDDEVLMGLKDRHPIVNHILLARQADKLIGTYVEKLPQMVGSDGRLRTTFRHTVARTGRLASEDPNLQNIPTRTADGVEIRRGFVATKDSLGRQCVLASLDLSQIEMVLAGHLSQDPVLLGAFRDGTDIHTITAANCFRLDRDWLMYLWRKSSVEEEGGDPGWLPGEKQEWKTFKSTKRLPAKCFHPDTEVLTRRGWVKITQLLVGEEVIQALPEREGKVKLEWVVPNEVFTQHHPSGKLIHLNNQGMDLRVTPDHRMLAWTNGGTPRVIEAKDFATAPMRYWANAGQLVEEGEDSTRPQEFMLRLAVALQADGSVNEWGGVKFGFSKARKVDRLKWLLSGASVPYSFSRQHNGNHGMVDAFSIRKQDAAKLLSMLDQDKTMPWSWVSMDRRDREIVLDEARHWDGCQQDARYIYSTSIRKNADVLQAIAAVTGRKSRMVETPNKDWSPMFTVSMKNHSHTRTENLASTEYEYTDKVACLSVPSSFVLVRDGGVPVICGQTVGFGILYGQTAEGAQGNIVAQGGPYLQVEEVEEIIRGWFDLYAGITLWMETQYWRAMTYGFVWDMWGRIRRIPEAQSKIKRVRTAGFRQAGNMPITASAQGLIKLDMAQIMPVVEYFQGFSDVRCWPLLQIHDELIFELSPNIAEDFCGIVQEIMQTNVVLTAPVKASWGIAERWGDLK